MKPASFAPLYCALYPEFAEVARRHGYALAIHGSLSRDMDLICVPWVETASEPQAVINELVASFAISKVGPASLKEHGRRAYTLSISFGDCFVDMSFMPRKADMKRRVGARVA